MDQDYNKKLNDAIIEFQSEAKKIRDFNKLNETTVKLIDLVTKENTILNQSIENLKRITEPLKLSSTELKDTCDRMENSIAKNDTINEELKTQLLLEIDSFKKSESTARGLMVEQIQSIISSFETQTTQEIQSKISLVTERIDKSILEDQQNLAALLQQFNTFQLAINNTVATQSKHLLGDTDAKFQTIDERIRSTSDKNTEKITALENKLTTSILAISAKMETESKHLEKVNNTLAEELSITKKLMLLTLLVSLGTLIYVLYVIFK